MPMIRPKIKDVFKPKMLNPKLTELELGYLVGLIDGEGTITITARKKIKKKAGFQLLATLTIVNTSENLAIWLQSLGFRKQKRKRFELYKVCYMACSEGYGILPLLKRIEPYLMVKQKQCQLVIKYIEKRLEMEMNSPYDKQDVEIMTQVRTLNMKGKRFPVRPLYPNLVNQQIKISV
jgi:hypothetical protein